jgi:adenosine deaminase
MVKIAELHVHLEGAFPPRIAFKLAERNRLPIPDGLISKDQTHYLSNGFLDFLKTYDVVAALIKKPEDYYDITFDYLRSNAEENTLYIEMMYSPDHAEQSSGIPSVEHLAAIQQAIDDAEAKFDIVGRILITAVRHYGVEGAERVARQTHRDRFPCITGFGLGGDEINFPPHLFHKAYHIAADAGLECTVHAGEFAGSAQMIEAMDHLPIRRIGHGINCIDSLETIQMLKERGIALELCPGSNIFFGSIKDMQSHPFPQFYEAGLKVSIGSDDPPFFSTTLAQEYANIQAAYGYSDEIMNGITRMAIEAAFVDEKTRQTLLQKIG